MAQKPDDRQGVFSFLVAAHLDQNDSATSALTELYDRVSQMKIKPTFIVAPGGLTVSGSEKQYAEVTAGVKRFTDSKIPFYAAPGSPDVSPIAGGKERFVRNFGKLYQSFDYNQVHFVLLDSTIALHGVGHLGKIQLDWLDKDLKRLKPETPILVFLYHTVGLDTPAARPLDNDYDLLIRLKGRNVAAIFMGDRSIDSTWNSNGFTMVTARPIRSGTASIFSVSPLIVSVERTDLVGSAKPIKVASIMTSTKVKSSTMRSTWDDPDIPFLERRRPAATLSPRAVADNPDREKGEYRIDSEPWRPLIKDRRDIWSDSFLTKGISIGIHTAHLKITTSNGVANQEELIFEVERDSREETRRWALDLPDGIQSSPVVSGDTVYVSCLDGKLYAINSLTGKKRWFYPTRGALVGSPVVSGGIVLVGSTDGMLHAVETASGRMKWQFDAGSPIVSTPATAQGGACIGSLDHIYCVDLESGLPRWNVPAASPVVSAAVADADSFYVSSSDGQCTAIEAASGVVRWRVPSSESGKTGKPARFCSLASPAVASGRVYLAGEDGFLHCLTADRGKEIWSRPAPEGADPIGCSPAIVGGNVVACGVGDRGSVCAFDAATGSPSWHVSIGQSIAASGIKAREGGGALALMGLRGRCVVLNGATGARMWGYELGPGNILSTPGFDGNILYTVTMANDVQAINGPGASDIPRPQPRTRPTTANPEP